MEEVTQLVNQIKILSETIELQLNRLDQAFKLLDETTRRLGETDRTLQTTNQALKTSLNESDQAIDDLATMTLALQKVAAKLQVASEQELSE